MLIALALASKEEAVLLPVVLLAWHRQLRRPWTGGVLFAVLAPLTVYAIVRSFTPAFTPTTAPAFYQFTFVPAHVLHNAAAYVDRSVTVVAIAVCVAVALSRARPTLDEDARRLLAQCAVWWAGMLAITVLLPVRSSLYAVCPSVGAAIAGAMLIDRTGSGRPTRWCVEYALALAVLLAVPIYRMRNHPWVEGARVSQRTLSVIRADAPALPSNGKIRLVDDVGTISTFHNAFGDLASEAVQTALGGAWTVEIATEPEPCRNPSEFVAQYQLVRGRVVRVPPCDATGLQPDRSRRDAIGPTLERRTGAPILTRPLWP
jgi:hypothetical protein